MVLALIEVASAPVSIRTPSPLQPETRLRSVVACVPDSETQMPLVGVPWMMFPSTVACP